MKKTSISWRIILACSTVVFLLGLLGYLGRNSLRRVQHSSETIQTQALPGVYVTGQIQSLAYETGLLTLKHLLSVNDDQREAFNGLIQTNLARVQALSLEYQQSAGNGSAQNLVTAYESAWSNYSRVLSQVVEFSNQGKAQQAMELKVQKLDPAFGQFLAAIQAVVQAGKQNGDSATADIAREVGSAKSQIRTVLLGSAWLCGLLLLCLIVPAIRQLGRVTQLMREAGVFVRDQARQLAERSDRLVAGASKQTAGMKQVDGSLQELIALSVGHARESDQMRQLAQASSGEIQRASATAQSLDTCIVTLHGTGHCMTGRIQELARASAELRTAMQEILAAGRSVSEMVKTIDGIAAQISLLALNATIEASRAGVKGLGFAVVAAEVKVLARQSAAAAARIADGIRLSRENSSRAAEVSESMISGIETLHQRLDNAGRDLDGCRQQSREVSNIIQELSASLTELEKFVATVARSSAEQSAGLSTVAQAADRVTAITEETAVGARAGAESVLVLDTQAVRLSSALDRLQGRGRGRGAGTPPGKSAAPITRGNAETFAAPVRASQPSVSGLVERRLVEQAADKA